MFTISSTVALIVAESEFAIEDLQTGCLNLNAYAQTIKGQVEARAMKPVKKGSIVMALARLADTYRGGMVKEADFKLYNLVSRSGLTELTYPKSIGLQKRITQILDKPEVQTAPFCFVTIGLGEISIVTHDLLAQAIRLELTEYTPTLHLQDLSSLTMQVGIETIDTPRQSYTVIKQLALRNITIVEYITSPTELTIILHSRNLKESFVILHDRFFAEV